MSQQHPVMDAWIEAGPVQDNGQVAKPARPTRLILLGAPGIGKGTQAALLSQATGACQLSTGDVFRASGRRPADQLSPVMREAMETIRAGKLVSDDTVVDMVRERVACLTSPWGFLLDGFPRTAPQADALGQMLNEQGIALDAVVNYELPIEEVVERISGRRTCKGCKAIFHMINQPPKQEGVCDLCGGELFQREDDNPQTVRVRMQVYQDQTAPLIDYYQSRGLLITICADGTPEEIFSRTMDALGAKAGA